MFCMLHMLPITYIVTYCSHELSISDIHEILTCRCLRKVPLGRKSCNIYQAALWLCLLLDGVPSLGVVSPRIYRVSRGEDMSVKVTFAIILYGHIRITLILVHVHSLYMYNNYHYACSFCVCTIDTTPNHSVVGTM